ncbi:hypothetical protein ACIRVK_45065 [Streptomyces sp. NPDC101152]|uniref:hypothetical protein n=1 Tax=Streptomyces sp. NPDC101152 TaxID=3366116 RepID=UPI00382E81E7
MPLARLVGVLRPEMLEVAHDQADGVHSFFVPPTHTSLARAVLGPGRLLMPEQAVVLATDAAEARGIAREHTDFYLRLPNRRNNLRTLGYSDDDFDAGGSDRLVDALAVWGDETVIARRIGEHLGAGADHVPLQPLRGLGAAVDQLERLAQAVLHG